VEIRIGFWPGADAWKGPIWSGQAGDGGSTGACS
jgi:hypothetical protein